MPDVYIVFFALCYWMESSRLYDRLLSDCLWILCYLQICYRAVDVLRGSFAFSPDQRHKNRAGMIMILRFFVSLKQPESVRDYCIKARAFLGFSRGRRAVFQIISTRSPGRLVCYTAVFSVVTQRSSPRSGGETTGRLAMRAT